MYMAALVRYFCVVGPRARSRWQSDRSLGFTFQHWWPNLSFLYLRAFVEAGIGVRALPIGGTFLQFPRERKWAHWQDLASCFFAEVAPHYVNVVCSPAGLVQGRRVTGRQLAPTRVVGAGGGEVPPQVLAPGARASAGTVDEPQLALVALRTGGVRNIAITGTDPCAPSRAEIEALKRYDAVVTPSELDARDLRSLGISAQHYAPDTLRSDANAIPCFFGVHDA
jgi:hypothetical protein